MPYSYSAYLPHRNQKVHIKTIDALPTDWAGLKLQVQEIMVQVHREYGLVCCPLVLELHFGGRQLRRNQGGAHTKKAVKNWRRGKEFYSNKVAFNPHTEEVTIGRPQFGAHLFMLLEDVRAEHGNPYHVPPIIPKETFDLGDPAGYLSDAPPPLYANYRPSNHQSSYGSEKNGGFHRRSYGQDRAGHTRSYQSRWGRMSEVVLQRRERG